MIIHILFFSLLGITLSIAIWQWKYYKETSERYYLWFLLYVCCHEILSSSYTYMFPISSNIIFYNLYTILSFLFYFFWFDKILQKRRYMIRVLLGIFIVVACFQIILTNPFHFMYVILIITGTACISVLAFSYFLELLSSNTIVKLGYLQKFWINIGLLIFHLGFVYTVLFSSFFGLDMYSIRISVLLLNCILYGCYSYGFLIVKKAT